jgi:hypothetical protein
MRNCQALPALRHGFLCQIRLHCSRLSSCSPRESQHARSPGEAVILAGDFDRLREDSGIGFVIIRLFVIWWEGTGGAVGPW